MFDKWKNIKIVGTVVILAMVAVFLFMNIRIKSASDYLSEKSTGILAENISEGIGENSTESRAEIVADGGQTSAAEDGRIDIADGGQGSVAEGGHIVITEGGQGSVAEGERIDIADGGQAGITDGEKNDSANSGQNQSGSSNQPETEEKKTIQVSIEIRCDSAVKIKDSIGNPGIKEKIPDSGEILKETVYIVPEGTDVYELLSMAAASNRIAITANANKTYVMSINNLDQMMLGQQSGWKYSVNNNVPLMAASSYILQSGDKVKWFYVLSANEE